MTISVFGGDEQSTRPVDLARWVRLAEEVIGAQEARGDIEVSLLFTDEATIADLNQRFLGRSGPTDVLAFPIDEEPTEAGRSPDAGGPGPGWAPPEPGDLPLLLGDVVICPEVAWRNAVSAQGVDDGEPAVRDHPGAAGPNPAQRAYEDELALLVVHGLLHLEGMDHEDSTEAEAMEALERELLGRFYRAADAPASDAVPQPRS